MIEVVAQLKHLRMSPKKVRLVSDAIKGMNVDEALLQLQYIQKRPAPIVLKLLKSAVANAQNNNNLTADKLLVKNVVVNEAVALKRWQPAAHGAAHPYKRRGSHVILTLGLQPGVTTEVTDAKKKGAKKEVTKTDGTEKKPAAKKADTKKVAKKPAAKKQATKKETKSPKKADSKK